MGRRIESRVSGSKVLREHLQISSRMVCRFKFYTVDSVSTVFEITIFGIFLEVG